MPDKLKTIPFNLVSPPASGTGCEPIASLTFPKLDPNVKIFAYEEGPLNKFMP
jgi:hypothetical protein